MKPSQAVRKSTQYRNLLLLFALGAWFAVAAHALGTTDAAPCSTSSENRQFDFWLGSWTITIPGGSGGATAKVSLALDKCLLVESWDNGKGHVGESMFAYSPEDKSWYGMYADNQSHVHIFVEGKVASGSAVFYGPSSNAKGEKVLNRIKVVRVTPNKVEHTWEKSTNNGASWITVFSGEYLRANP